VPVHVIEAAESPQLTATLKLENRIWQVAWTPDGRTLAAVSLKEEVTLWDVAARKERASLRSDLGESYSVAFTPDGKTLVLGHYKNDAKTGPTGGISLWDVATGQRKDLLQRTPPRAVSRLALSPDGQRIGAMENWREGDKGAYKRCIALWDIAGGKPNTVRADESSGVLVFAPGGNVLAWSALVIKDGEIAAAEVRRHDLANKQELPALPNPVSKNPLNSLAYAPDGRSLAGADYAGNIILWDTATGKVRASMKQEHERRVRSLAFSPDSKTLAAAVGDRARRDHEPGLIELWDAATGRRRLVLTGHTNEVLSVAFSPDGALLASGSSDRTVRLWDVTSPELP
jgi:WD40 repeat protein